MRTIAAEIAESPDRLHEAPVRMPVGRPDEVQAARKPILTYRDALASRASQTPQPVRPL
jgi:glycine dehydrogenase subunit 2